MAIILLTKRELEVINKRKLKYPLAVAEKDYFLAIVSKIVYDSPLKNKLVFKGGTALHHCYLNQMRFSEDLDFTSLDNNLTVNAIKKIFKTHNFLEVKKEFVSPATIKIERLSYTGPLGLPNSLKVEFDYKQNVVLPAREMRYKNVWNINTKVKVMDIKEVCAEKIRATSDRARFRDFYDLFQILEKFHLNLDEIIKLIRQKEIRKPISKLSILNNWKIAQQERNGLTQKVYYSEEITNLKIRKKLSQLKFKIIK